MRNSHAVEAKIHVVLEHRHELAKDRAVGSRDIDLSPRLKSVVPLRSLWLDDETAERALIGVLDRI
jgi:hypothetical protein